MFESDDIFTGVHETTTLFLEYIYISCTCEDDWVLFEQEALLREESEFEEEGSKGSGSMESLPPY